MEHIGFIMDGNRTWAKENNLPAFEGHRQGYENAIKILNYIKARNIPFVTLWALSDDNIRKRDARELEYLFELLSRGILHLAKESNKNNIRLLCIGDRTLLPEKCRKNIKKSEELTLKNTGMTAIIAVAYGGREEIIRALHSEASKGTDMHRITEDDILSSLESAQFPSPDFIIRTGGHIRHSGFLLFQSPYAEYYFSSKNWPDFDENELDIALRLYENSVRKFGK